MSAYSTDPSVSELEHLLAQAQNPQKAAVPKPEMCAQDIIESLNASPIKIGCRAIQNGHGVRVALAGNLSISARPKWRLLLNKIQQSPARQVEINFSRIGRLSITGVGLILWLKEFLQLERGDLRITGCPDDVRQQLYWFDIDKHCIVLGKNFS